MDDLISRKALLERIESERRTWGDAYEVEEVLCDVEDFPTIEAEPVRHGRWVNDLDENGFLCSAWRKCSVCGGLNFSKRPPYCPNCGAKMDGDSHD